MALDIDDLARVVGRQAAHLKVLLHAPSRDDDDLHVGMATTLRTMLCGKSRGEVPTLRELAKELDFTLRVFGPAPRGLPPPQPGHFFMAPIVVSETPFWLLPGVWAPLMTVDDWLEAPIGVLEATPALGNVKARPTRYYTPRDVIERTANQDGGAHYQVEKDPSLEAIKNQYHVVGDLSIVGPGGIEQTISGKDAMAVRSPIVQISAWALAASGRLLDLYAKRKEQASPAGS